MLKYCFSLATLLFIALVATAQNELDIRVVDKENRPVQGATVTVGQLTGQTDDRGIVIFRNLNKDHYTVRVTHVGFETLSQEIATKRGTFTLALAPATRQTGEVFISAIRARENASTTFKNITKEELRKTNLGQDIPFLLDQTPGVVVSSDAGAGIGPTGMTIRGSDNQRINVTLNGIPLNDAESMGSFFVNLPDFASSVESIQIQRGIGTSTNGAGAFGASLNIQTDVLETKPYAELNNSFGSFNSWKNTVKVGSGLINDKYAFNARLSRIASDGYVERATSDMKSFYIDGGLYTQKHTLKATVFAGDQTTYQAWYGTPEPLVTGDHSRLLEYANNALGISDGPELDRYLNADRRYNYYTYDDQTDNYKQTHAHVHYTFSPNERWSINTALHYTKGAGYYEEFREQDSLAHYRLENVVVDGKPIKKTDFVRRRWLDNHFFGGTYAILYKPSSALNLTLGGAYHQYDGDHFGEIIWARITSGSEIGDRYYNSDATKKDFNTYAKLDYRSGAWLLNLDLQYRNVNYRSYGSHNNPRMSVAFDDNLHFFNPKAGATYFLNNRSNLYASYAFGNKEPVRDDYVDRRASTFPKPEKMHNVEAGYRYRDQQFNIGINAYGMFYKDQLVQTGAVNDVGATIRENVPDSYRMGVEFDGGWHISPQFVWQATAALSTNKIKNFIEYVPIMNNAWDEIGMEEIHHGTTDIVKSPSTVLSSNFTYRPTEPLSFSLTSKYVSRIFLDNTSSRERSIAPSFVNNLRAVYSFSALGLENVDLNLAVNNIFNEKYATNGYTFGWINPDLDGQRLSYNFLYPQATTNFLLGLNIRF